MVVPRAGGVRPSRGAPVTPPAPPARPRLGIVISMFPELHETFILRELVALERRGVEFDVFSLQYPRDPITIEEARRLSETRTTYSPLISAGTLGAFARALLRRPHRVLGAMARVAWQGRDRPADVVKNLAVLPIALRFGEIGRARGITRWHGHWANVPTTACWYLGEIEGVEWSAAIHGEDIFSPNRFLARKLDAAVFSVVCSGFFCRHLREEIGLAEPERVHLNYHGLDPRVLERAAARKRDGDGEGGADGGVRLVSIGRLVPTKGHDTLIRALARLIEAGRDVTLEIVGSGPIEATLRELARERGVHERVVFRGALAFADVLEALERADVFCLAPRLLPGHPPDGIPNVIAEAMALGVPVVTTRVSAIPELVEDGRTGRLVRVDDDAAFAAALADLIDDPAAARELARAARVRVSELFDQERNIDELIALFDAGAAAATLGVPGSAESGGATGGTTGRVRAGGE